MKLINLIVNRLKNAWHWFLIRSKKVKVTIILIFLFILYLGYKNVSSKNFSKIQYQTETAQVSTLVISVSASGSVVSSNQMPITTNASGIVSEVYVKDGDKVTKGQKIASIDLDSDGSQRYAQAYSSYMSSLNSVKSAENGLRSAQASLNNVYDQLQGHATDETFAQIDTRTKAEVAKDNAYNSLQMAKIQVNSSYLAYLQNSPIIYANYTGTINDITIVPGMDLSTATTTSGNVTSQSVAIIETTGLPLISVNVSEIDVSNIKQDQKVTVTFDSISNKTFTGKVVSVNKIGTVSSGVTNYPVIIQFDTAIPELLPNMTAQANIITDTISDALLVPTTAIQSLNGQSTVRILKNGKISTINVEVGKSSDSETQILSGISEGDTVITNFTQSTTGSSNQTQSPFSAIGGGGGVFRTRTTTGGNATFRD